ncbi:hypothetical protein JKF63_01008 [Porcisia hertigi]|uniref:Uncharacterized protein n=1 Tax=Porcisia hertigi TaxID=2761500 RepID=A0A836IC41_9TRYP|nr:hypothetical protein JKF63_01008 [Porcisia hertigi]
MPLRKKHTGVSGESPKESKVFDPVAYAASIAVSAAEKRLRAPHARCASSSIVRPCFTRAPVNGGASKDSLKRIAVVQSPTASASAPPCSFLPHTTAVVATAPRTLLEELACASDSPSGADAAAQPILSHAVCHKSTPVDVSRDTFVRSPSPPASPYTDISRSPSDLASGHMSLRLRHEEVRSADTDEDDCETVSLRDASPLREHSVSGTTGFRYHTCTVESVHSIVRKLNFSLFQ